MHPHAESPVPETVSETENAPGTAPPQPSQRSGVLRPLWSRAREAGQGTIEYIGIAVAAGLIIAGLLAVPFGPRMASGINDIICGIFSESPFGGTSCASQKPITPEDYMTECPVLTTDQRRGSEVDIAFVTLGSGVSMKVVKMSDGTAQVSLIGDVTAGANFEAAKVEADEWLKVNAGVGADITGSMGDTWQFDSWDAADAFADENRRRVEDWKNRVPILGTIINKSKAPDNSRISTYALDVSTWGNADAGINLDRKPREPGKESKDGQWKSSDYDEGTDFKPGSNAGSNLDFNNLLPKGEVSVDQTKGGAYKIDRGDNLDDPSDDIRTYTFDVSNSGQGSVKGLGFDAGGNAGIETAFSVKVDSDGNVIGLQISQSHKYGGGTGGAKDDNTSKVYTADIDLSDPAARQTITDFMANPGGLPDFESLAKGDIRPQTPEQQAMVDLLRSPNVKLNEMTMNNVNESDGVGLGVKLLGLGLGYDTSDTSSESTLTDAYTYVPNASGGYDRVKNTKCS